MLSSVFRWVPPLRHCITNFSGTLKVPFVLGVITLRSLLSIAPGDKEGSGFSGVGALLSDRLGTFAAGFTGAALAAGCLLDGLPGIGAWGFIAL